MLLVAKINYLIDTLLYYPILKVFLSNSQLSLENLMKFAAIFSHQEILLEQLN